MPLQEVTCVNALRKNNLDDFNASHIWFIRGRTICGEEDDVLVITVEAWIEQLPEFTKRLRIIKNLEYGSTRTIFKAVPEKGLSEKSLSAKGSKKYEQICTAAIFSAANSSKVTDPVLIGRSRKPNRFRNLKDIRRALNVHYCSNEKSWMNTKIMEFRLKIVWRG